MKKTLLMTTIIFVLTSSFANDSQKIEDTHNSIYTMKIKRIVNAINLGNFSTDKKYFDVLEVACERNKCSDLEKQTILSVGQQLVNCQVKHLKSHQIENADANSICESKQAIFGCDSLSTSLLRRMCYTGNNYDLALWETKEKKLKSRLPASK